MNYLEAWDRYANLAYADLPETVRQVAHQCLLDWIGCAIAGSREPLSGILREEFSHRAGKCSLIGVGASTDAATAALLNGASGHALDYDDTNVTMGCHPTAPVLPAVLAAAEEGGATAAELITALVVGIEIQGRVGLALGMEHYHKGWHSTGTCGVFGAAAAVSHLLKLDRDTYAMAMSLAASKAAGLKANFGTMTKPLHAGMAAEAGLIAARLTARGLTASHDAVYGNQGYIEAAGVGDPHHEFVQNAADHWLILDNLFKYHAACHLTHGAIEGLLALRNKIGDNNLGGITLTVSPDILGSCGIPEPRTGLEAKFSLVGNAAYAWLGVDTSNPEVYSNEVISRDDVQQLLRKVVVETDDRLKMMQTRLCCMDTAGNRHEEYRDSDIPETDVESQAAKLIRKFTALTGNEQFGRELLQLDTTQSVSAVIARWL